MKQSAKAARHHKQENKGRDRHFKRLAQMQRENRFMGKWSWGIKA